MAMDASLTGLHMEAVLLLPAGVDPEKTTEWREAFDGVVRVCYLLQRLIGQALQHGIEPSDAMRTTHRNTLHHSQQLPFAGGAAIGGSRQTEQRRACGCARSVNRCRCTLDVMLA